MKMYAMEKNAPSMAPSSVYLALKAEIITAKLEPGAALKQDHLAERFGVSHVPVREALSRLVADGLAVARAHKGTSVSTLTPEGATELVEIRWLLEGRLMELAVPNLSRADIDLASKLLDQLSESSQIDEVVQLNHAFHSRLYQKAERPLLMQSVEAARLNLGRYLYLPWHLKGNLERSDGDHRKLLKLCLGGNAAGAKALVQEHVLTTGKLIVDIINTEQSKLALKS